ncbi:MAG: response regulator [Spirochaetia bacterium]|nr:response regulator [Spirochaetia bacterium]
MGLAKMGVEALDFLRKNLVDLVLLDVYMPLMNEREVLEEIRNSKIETEVIMVTAANDTSTLEETVHLGVVDYLIKRFSFERFQNALEKFTAQHQAFKEKKQWIKILLIFLLIQIIKKKSCEFK